MSSKKQMKVGLQKKSQPSDYIRGISFDISALFNWQENQTVRV